MIKPCQLQHGFFIMVKRALYAILLSMPLVAQSQYLPERHACIGLYYDAKSKINSVVTELVMYKRKGAISYKQSAKWQNIIMRETEYPYFKLHQSSYDGNTQVCQQYHDGIVNVLTEISINASIDISLPINVNLR